VPQRVTWERDYARAELMRDLEASKPAAIVVQRHDVFPAVTGDALDSRDSLPFFPELAGWIGQGYELTTTIEDFELYERRAPAAPAAPLEATPAPEPPPLAASARPSSGDKGPDPDE